jgi:transcriptional regulator with XRE-family HTH domain
MKIKRSAEKRITKEMRVVRFMRMSRGISMRKAGAMLGLSDSLISHIEQGRQDLPKDRAAAMVQAYRYTWQDFQTFIATDEIPYTDPKDACIQLLDRIPLPKLATVLSILKGFAQ